jgi:acyl carrier protein
MEKNEIRSSLLELVRPFAKNKDALASASDSTSFLKDLNVSSSRLVDIVLDIEDKFGIEVADDEADTITTVGAAIELIETKLAA